MVPGGIRRRRRLCAQRGLSWRTAFGAGLASRGVRALYWREQEGTRSPRISDESLRRLTSSVSRRVQRRLYRGGKAKLRIRSPPRRPLSPPPDATVTNCSPSTMYIEGDEKTPAPVLNCQSFSPVTASKAKK